jgi:hypothetical protein
VQVDFGDGRKNRAFDERWRTMRIAMILLLAAFLVDNPTAGMEHKLLRIHEPREQEQLTTTANIATNGYVLVPGFRGAHTDLSIQVRLYRPANGNFVVVQEFEGIVQPERPGEPGVYGFIADIKTKKAREPGQYLVRVECLDKRDKNPRLLASQMVFITVVRLSAKSHWVTTPTGSDVVSN